MQGQISSGYSVRVPTLLINSGLPLKSCAQVTLRDTIIKIKKDVIRLVTSVGQRKRVPMRNQTSELRIPRFDALPLSGRDSTASEVYYEVHMTRILQYC